MEALNKFLSINILAFGESSITIGQLLLLPLVLIVGGLFTLWLARFISARMTAHGTDPNFIQLVHRLIIVAAILILAFLAMDLLNIPLTAFAFFTGALAVGIGFGAQNVINNLIAGWILMGERPIRIGDYLEVGEAKGTVESINRRATRIRRMDGVHLLVPNSYLLENIVVNWTLVDKFARATVRVGVMYGSSLKKVIELIEQALVDLKSILENPAPLIVFAEFGDNSLEFDIYFWAETDDYANRELRKTRSDLRMRIYELFQENDIVIAFPQRDVHLDGALTIRKETEGGLPDSSVQENDIS